MSANPICGWTIGPRGTKLWQVLAFSAILWGMAGSLCCSIIAADEAAKAEVEKPRPARPSVALINVPLPIRGLVDTQVMQQVEHALQTLPAEPRPILIFEFSSSQQKEDTEDAAAGSQFERALSLARFLSGEKLSRARTIAYLPQTVTGHAVLPVMACEQIIMHPDADLGNAGIDESSIDATLSRAYIEIADRRRTIPAALAIGMLDRSAAVFRVQTPEGVRFVLDDERQQLQQDGRVTEVETVIREGDLGLFAAKDLRVKYALVSHLAADHAELATALELPRDSLDGRSLLVEVWRPIHVRIDGPIHPRLVTQIITGVNKAIADGSANILLIQLRSGGGDLRQSIRLANFLARDIDRKQMRTLVFVEREARGDAAIVALAADDLVVTSDAILGGPGNGRSGLKTTVDVLPQLQEIAKGAEREWSLITAMIDPKLKVYRWTHDRSNDVRFMTDEEQAALPDSGEWSRGDLLRTDQGLAGIELQGSPLLHGIANNEAEVAALYGWEGKAQEIKSNWALGLIEVLADPRLAFFLLVVAWSALWIEMSSPGIGVPGFISALCFLLFFWSQFLHGTAGVLEILLFLFGVSCIAIEIFVIPGVGIFGFGGALLVIVSMVLASQTFVIPANSYQLRQLPISLLTVAASASGGLIALLLVRRFLPYTPFFNRLLLSPPQGDDLQDLHRRESFGEWNFLLGKRGEAATPLVPSGKARFGDDLVEVLSEGELIDRGAAIEVIEVQGMRIVVRQVG